jgi:RNA polymerase sigma-70 factor (ECF subfamily)
MTTFTTPIPVQSEFERLLRPIRRRIYNLAYRLTGNATDAEDVTQDAYLRAWQHFDSYDASRSFEAWICRIVTNRVIDLHRRGQRARIISLDTPGKGEDDGQPLSDEVPAPNSDPEQIVIRQVMEERLQQALRDLPMRDRTVITLCDVEECSYEETADIMHCAVGTVRSRLHRARRLLRRRMESQPGTDAKRHLHLS